MDLPKRAFIRPILRPVSYFLPAGIGAVMLLLTLVSDAQRWRRSLQIAAFVCVAMGITATWQLRNLASADYGGFSAISDINLYFY